MKHKNQNNKNQAKKAVKKNIVQKTKKNKVAAKKIKIKRKRYSSEDLNKAIEAVNKGTQTMTKIAEKFGIPLTTLHRKVTDPKKQNKRSGPPTVLPENVEKEIATWIKRRAEMKAPVTKGQLLKCVQIYVQDLKIVTPFKEDKPGRHWYEGFLKRNPDLSIRTPQNLTVDRASVSENDLRMWFTEVEDYLKGKDLINIESSRVFNCDESSIMLCPKSEKVITEKGSRAVYKVVGHEKECLTTLFMYSADGSRAPPMILYKYKEKIPARIAEKCPSDWGMGASESGWMTSETFYEYVTNIFYPWLVKNLVTFPILLYFDGHSSHMTMPLVKFCKEKEIELISLLPNSTHILQPLDIGFFHPFKETWKKTLTRWLNEHELVQLEKHEFAPVLKESLDCMKEEKQIIVNSFKATGLMPFNPNIDYSILKKKVKEAPQDLAADNNGPNSFLFDFEAKLPKEILAKFKQCEVSGVWGGRVEDKSLFDFWLQQKQKTSIDKSSLQSNPNCDGLVNNLVSQKPPTETVQLADDAVMKDQDINIPLERNETITVTSNYNESLMDAILPSTSNISFISNDSGFPEPHFIENYEIIFESELEVIQPVDINVTETELENSEKEKVSTLPSNQDISNEKDNVSVAVEDSQKSFDKAFTFPQEYMSKKRKMQLEKKGRPKQPAVGTSNDWIMKNAEKEQQRKIKDEQAAEKKKLMEEKKKINEKLKLMQKKIKQEKK